MAESAWLQFVPFAIVLVIFVPALWAATTVLKKMGYTRWLVVLWLVPIVNFFFLIWLARSEWPIEAELKRLRASAA
jgi:hypothetical protein